MIYEYMCPCGKVEDRVLRLSEYKTPQFCDCGREMQKVILTAPMGFVQADICYDSPITGEAITSRQKRIEDMARHGCVEYDPGMRQDYQRRIAESEAALDKSVEKTVDQIFETLPAHKKESLASELTAGAGLDVIRTTAE